MSLPVTDIIHLIPQKPPFVMVEKLLYVDENNARSSFIIKADNVFVKDNLFQEAGLMENIAQTVALGAGYLASEENKPAAVGYIAAVKDLEIFGLPKVGDDLVTEISVQNRIMGITVIAGKVWHDGHLLAQCEMKVFSPAE
jgi:predicted hotdog family 3-hydroxylacyl-ACP dehydratase